MPIDLRIPGILALFTVGSLLLLAGEDEARPAFEDTRPALNPTELVLHVDGTQVLGWVTGTRSFRGAPVSIEGVEPPGNVRVRGDNTFTWRTSVDEPTRVTIRVAELEQQVLLKPAPDVEPSVFFVVDRSAHRPGQLLQFAGFLRESRADGTWIPRPHTEVNVHLTSRGKKTIAARLPLVSDGFGRIVGEYRFQEADTLDTYDLSIPGYRGQAPVTLAEFRKAKVRLSIEPELDGQELTLSFRGLDFLGEVVGGSRAHYTVRVLRAPTTTGDPGPLDPRQFVYREALPSLDLQQLSDEERLLVESGQVPAPHWGGLEIVAERTGQLPLTDGVGTTTFQLPRRWLEGPHTISVEGALVDYNGREHRATRTVAIGEKTLDCDLHLSLRNRHFATGEEIEVRIDARDASGQPAAVPSTLLVERLSPRQVQSWGYGYYSPFSIQSGIQWSRPLAHLLGPDLQPKKSRHGWQERPVSRTGTVDGELVTAAVATDGVATFTLEEAGAYRLVAIVRLPGGQTLRNEIGCVVHEPADLPGLLVRLDSDTFESGDRVRGTIHSRFANAVALVTLRDSRGVRTWKSVTLDGSTGVFDLALPDDTRYGASIEVDYVDGPSDHHVARQTITVLPRHRMLEVVAEVPDTVEPGDEVTVDLSVNRSEPVDLVVSVYDQSLLGISPDRSPPIESFYLADDRARHSGAETLRRRLRGITMNSILARAEALLEDHPEVIGTPTGHSVEAVINNYRGSGTIHAQHLGVVFELAGIPTVMTQPGNHYFYGFRWSVQVDRTQGPPALLHDLVTRTRDRWGLTFQFVGQTLFLGERNALHTDGNPFMGQLFLGQRSGYGFNAFSDSNGFFAPAANGVFSMAGGPVSGQSFVSHLPAAGEVLALAEDSISELGVRRDFSDSAFWNAQVRTDEHGRAQVTFRLPDSLTNWHVVVTAVSPRLHVGRTTASFRTFKPVMIWPMVPRVFTPGDVVELFGSVHNRTEEPQRMTVTLEATGGSILSDATVEVDVPALGNAPVYWTFQPRDPGFTELLMSVRSPAGNDASLKRLPVREVATDRSLTVSGFCRGTSLLEIPESVDLSRATLEITLVPSLVDDLVHSLGYLVDYPYGCVEQTMSRFLPAIEVSRTLDRIGLEDPALMKKLPDVVEQGIKRLLQLQAPDGGWAWQGGGQSHEMMTPYALYGLLKAESAGYVLPNEEAVKTGLRRLRSFIDHIDRSHAADRIYCISVYALRHDLKKEWWDFIRDARKEDRLSDYALALSLELAARHGQDDLARALVADLEKRAQRLAGATHWRTARFSRWGDDPLEITAAVLKALVAHDPSHELIASTLDYFARSKRGNRWNSTKDTAMIIYAICDYLAEIDYRPGEKSVVSVAVNDGESHALELAWGKPTTVRVPAKGLLRHGSNGITVDREAPGALLRAVLTHRQVGPEIEPYSEGITVKRKLWLLGSQGQKLHRIEEGDTVPRGSYIEIDVTATHDHDRMQYVLVESPKLSGSEIVPVTDPRFNQHSTPVSLREDRTEGVAFHHEQTSRELSDRYVVHVELEGSFVLPPAQVELMYDTATRGHSGLFRLRVGEERQEAAGR